MKKEQYWVIKEPFIDNSWTVVNKNGIRRRANFTSEAEADIVCQSLNLEAEAKRLVAASLDLYITNVNADPTHYDPRLVRDALLLNAEMSQGDVEHWQAVPQQTPAVQRRLDAAKAQIIQCKALAATYDEIVKGAK